MKNDAEKLWEAVLASAEWKAFNNQLDMHKSAIEHILDFCDDSGTSEGSVGDQEIYLNEIYESIDCISENVTKLIDTA